MNGAVAPIRYVFTQPVAAPPGTVFNYNSGNTVALGTALTKAVGRELPAYARAKLFERLNFGLSEWVYVSEGREPAFRRPASAAARHRQARPGHADRWPME